MADTLTKIEGLDGFKDRLSKLSVKIQKKALGSALRKGAAVIRADAVRRARAFDNPKTPKQVFKEIAVRADNRAGRAVGGAVVHIGVKGGAKQYKNNARNRGQRRVGKSYEGPGNVYYWRFLEYGTSKMAARPFLRPALSGNITQATAAIVAALSASIAKYAAEK